MGIKKFKPTTPGRRWMTVNTFEEITTSTPYKALTVKLKKSSGRNNTWRITVRHQWGGHAKRYRLVDFYSVDKKGIEARVETIEYDPYRSAFISLVCSQRCKSLRYNYLWWKNSTCKWKQITNLKYSNWITSF